MIRLFFLLLGAQAVRRRWPVLATFGLIWFLLGSLVFLDALDGSLLFPMDWLGYALIGEGGLAVAAGSAGLGLSGAKARGLSVARQMRWGKGALLTLIGVLTIETSGTGGVLLALLIGTAFAVDGALKVAAARVIRFRGWRLAQAMGLLSLLLAVLTLQPWPTWYAGTIGCNVGIAMALSGVTALLLAYRLLRLPRQAPLSDLVRGMVAQIQPGPAHPQPGTDLFIRVWVPTGTEKQAISPVGRYIAAVDKAGIVSAGHAALEAGNVYISHYPATEIDRDLGNFSAMLRGTAENDVPGLFKPGYLVESVEWMPATHHVRFPRYNAARLEAFWAAYHQNATYNLTRRNCSSAVAAALDAALEGVLAVPRRSRIALVCALLSPELWVATLLRRRAETMTWTPGLLLDYARAIAAVVDPPPLGWPALVRRALARRHRLVRAYPGWGGRLRKRRAARLRRS